SCGKDRRRMRARCNALAVCATAAISRPSVFPPPRLPPYTASRAEQLRNSVCGPGFGRQMIGRCLLILALLALAVAKRSRQAARVLFAGCPDKSKADVPSVRTLPIAHRL